MAVDYSIDVCNTLKDQYNDLNLHRPMRLGRYDAGTRLSYDITGVAPATTARVDLKIEKFVGGGFAGQVYRVKILDIESQEPTEQLPVQKDGVYAMKILIPPSGFARFFRNFLYRIGFQGPFQLQVNPTASRAGALWQKLIRRGAGVRLNNESAVNDIHATFVDSTLGSCGEISDWVDGRTWRLEVDDRLDQLKRFFKGKKVDPKTLGSPEYRAKKEFMRDFVKLLHEMGAHEFARQYEWSTCKSQPNCLKRNDTENDPSAGLMAVDFRAGLSLLPLLPMSPGDVLLIFKGLARGSLVQFDRGNLKKLERFMDTHGESFADLKPMLEELKACEEVYRNSVPDITHNHVRLLYSKKLWSTINKSMRIGWRVRNFISEKTEEKLNKSFIKTWIFSFLGAVPILGGFLRKIWGRPDWRKHYASLFGLGYLKRAMRGKAAEQAMAWHRAGRIDGVKAEKIAGSFGRYLLNLPLSILPIGLYKFFTSFAYLKERLFYLFVRPVKLYFSASMREEWLLEMVEQGEDKRILTKEDAAVIHSQMKEPYIQKYLRSLAVHVLTLPVTQVVSLLVSWLYVTMHPELSTAEALAAVAAILVLFQITPISPGSLVRGFYVVGLMIKDRSFKDYNIAVFLGFFKYIGYLAFPIQMAYRYPELARFMAGHWATEAVHIVPVFGEQGALLEHWIFRLFYNWPLTIRRKMKQIAEMRETLKSRYWHVFLYSVLFTGVLTAGDVLFLKYMETVPTLKNTWWLMVSVSFLGGMSVTMGAGGAARSKRFLSAMIWGILTGVFYTAGTMYWVHGVSLVSGDAITAGAWNVFILAVLGTIGAILTELKLPAPKE